MVCVSVIHVLLFILCCGPRK